VLQAYGDQATFDLWLKASAGKAGLAGLDDSETALLRFLTRFAAAS
jgi:hypothetical protein